MAEERIFVGRKDELEQFGKVLENPKGQAVLVVGQAGMGKTWLTHKMTEVAENHPDLTCGWVRYEVTPTDSVDSTMALMMDNAFEAASTEPGSFDKVPQRKKQWMALLKTVVPKGGEIAELINSLKRDQAKNTREQFLERLELVSERMPENGRAVFIIDPEKYLQKESDYAWGIVVDRLPDKVKFLFPQRPEDVLVQGEGLDRCDNVVQIPEGELKPFDEQNIEELVSIQSERTPELEEEVRSSVKRSDKSPYAVTGTLELITGAGMKAEDLAQYLTQEDVAEAQWRGVCERGEEAIRLFKAYAILEVPVPGDVVEAVSGQGVTERKRLQKDKYLRGLLREEEEGLRIYHAILADYILGQIGESEKKEYNNRAVEVYREKLKKAKEEETKPDALAATRLAEHVLEAEGKEAFVDAFINECTRPLLNLGLLDSAIALSERVLVVVEKDSVNEAAILGNHGLFYQTRGELDKAEEMFRESLKIEERLGRLDGMAAKYGNLGLIYQKRGELDEAEEMHKKALEIKQKLGNKEGIAIQYGNLGLVYETRGELDKAEEMHQKALEIDEKVRNTMGVARHYGNLGVIYGRRGELDKAEEFHKKALEIEKNLGRLEGIANQCGNLGMIYAKRAKLDKAEEMFNRVLEIEEKLGRLDSIANSYGNLGIVYQIREELDKAEEMHKKSLDIAEKLGILEEVARQYGNLGILYKTRGDLDKAEEMHKKSLEIEEKIGRLEGIANDYSNLGLVYKARGDIAKAREYWEKSLELYKKIGMPHEVEKVESWLRELSQEGKSEK